MVSREIFFWVLPLMYAVFTGVFATLALSERGSAPARYGAAAFGIAVLAIVLDTQRQYFPSWFFTIAVPLHWLVIIFTANAFLSRHSERVPLKPAVFTFAVGLAINLLATFFVDSVEVRVPNASIVAIMLLTMALPKFFRRSMRMLDKITAFVIAATWLCYIIRFVVYFALDQSAEYARNPQWSQNMLIFYFSSAIIALSLAFLLILTITADIIERHHSASTIDPLTAVANRRGLKILAAQHQAQAKFGAVMMVDLDRFKAINDEFGHSVGDAVIVATARTLLQSSLGFGEVARLGGEEFVLLVHANQAEAVVELAELLRTAIAATRLSSPHENVRFTASIGAASIEPDESIDDAMARADMALYRAKEAGRDRVGYARSGFSARSLAAA